MLSSIKTCTIVVSAVSIFFASLSTTPALAKDDSANFYQTLHSINLKSEKDIQNVEANINFSPSVQINKQKKYNKLIERSLSFWSKQADLGNVSILLWSPKDISWAKQRYSELTQGWGYDPEQLNNDIRIINGVQTCANSSNGTRYSRPYSTDPELNHIARICVNEKMSAWHWHVLAHELTHVWQMSTVKTNVVNKPWLWVVEGGATYYGVALSGIGHKKYKKTIDHMYSTYFNYNDYGKSFIKKLKRNSLAIEDLFDLTRPPAANVEITNASYFVGSLVVSKIVEIYGHKKFVEYYESFNTNYDYKENFKKVYGVDFSVFCDRIASDIVSQIK